MSFFIAGVRVTRLVSASSIVLASFFLTATALAAPVSTAPATPAHTDFISTLQAARDTYDRQDYHLAATLYAKVVQANPVNPDYWRSLAASHYLAGEYQESIPAYKMALQMRQDEPATLAFFLARAYAKAGAAGSGMHWLRQSMQWGFSDSERARTDDAIKILSGQPGFNDLLGIVDASHMTRYWNTRRRCHRLRRSRSILSADST